MTQEGAGSPEERGDMSEAELADRQLFEGIAHMASLAQKAGDDLLVREVMRGYGRGLGGGRWLKEG